LDFTRDSDTDNTGAQHTTAADRLAVLEFELRKARETIQMLRQQLTKASGLIIWI